MKPIRAGSKNVRQYQPKRGRVSLQTSLLSLLLGVHFTSAFTDYYTKSRLNSISLCSRLRSIFSAIDPLTVDKKAVPR
jgi:hypothetical protein